MDTLLSEAIPVHGAGVRPRPRRLLGGQVTDYVHFFYVFNAADFAIIAGVGVLFVAVVRSLEGEASRQGTGVG